MKKFKLLLLTFMLIVNSLVGVTPIAFAEENIEDVGEIQEAQDNQKIELEEEGTEILENATEVTPAASKGNEKVTNEGVNSGENESTFETEVKVANEETKMDIDVSGTGGTAGDMPSEKVKEVMKSTEFTVDGELVEGTGPVTVQNGQTAQFKFNMELASGHSYGPGTTMTYTLPETFNNITFPQGTAFGNLGEITKSGNDITITFNDNIHDGHNGTGFEPGAHFYIEATFNNTGDNVKETINLPGQDNIKLNFTPLGGKPIEKDVEKPQKNASYIDWTVMVNTDLSASSLGSVQFMDSLTGAHKFNTTEQITIQELTMGPNGIVSEGTEQKVMPTYSTNTSMTLELDGTKAYRIKYKTYPEDPGNSTSVSYHNKATYNNSQAEQSAKISYDPPLEKTRSEPNNNNLETSWEIKFNHNERELTDITISDTWITTGGSGTQQQELVNGTSGVEVYDKEDIKVTDPAVYTVTQTPGQQGFEITFHGTFSDAYTIKYKTKPVADTFVTKDMTVSNSVTRSDNPTVFKDAKSVTYSKNDFMLNKSVGNVNYADKTIPWTITANQAGYNLAAGTTFTDTFTNQNMTLKPETLKVIIDGIEEPNEGVDYTLTNNGKDGFNIALTNGTDKPVVITYTTDYDIRDIGTNDRVFHNNVVLNNSVLPVDPSDSATRSVATEQTKNGKKDGKYNYATKQFEWEVELNFNYNTLTNAIFEDELPDTQEIFDIEVHKGTLDSNGNFIEGDLVPVTNSADNPNYEIKLVLGNINQPHRVTYKSKDADGVFPETAGKIQIINSATLKDGTTPNASWTKTVGVNYTDKLIKKSGRQIGGTAGIKWNFEFNYAQSDLKNIVITDTVGKDGPDGNTGDPNQLIKPDSFKVYEVALSGKSDSVGFNATKQNTQLDSTKYELDVDIQAGTFELKLPDGDSAYYIEYETMYMGDSGSKVQNEVAVNYKSSEGNQASNNFSISNFKYGNAGTTFKVPFVVVKTDGATGEPMEGVEFTLYSDFQPGVALISKKTDAKGVFDLGMKLTEGNYTLKETPVHNYDDPGDINFKLDRTSVANSGPHDGKQVVEVENWKTGVNACTQFTLTIKDVDRNVVANKNVTLTNEATGQKHTVATNGDGEITLESDAVKAGTYTVTINEGGSEVTLGDVIVKYNGDCKAEVQPKPACENFTITLTDKKNNALAGVEMTLKGKDGNGVKATSPTDADGKTTIPSENLPAGTYKVYEGDVYLGDVTVSYKDVKDCSDAGDTVIVTEPVCENCTIIIQDRNGNPRDGVDITIKDMNGQEVIGKDEDGNDTHIFTTDTDGKVSFPNHEIKAGMNYRVYEGNILLGNFKITDNCTVAIKPSSGGWIPPLTCDAFTITVTKEGKVVKEGVELTFKLGTTEVTGTTDANGNIIFAKNDLPEGTYVVYDKDGNEVGTVDVTYEVNKCQAAVNVPIIDTENPEDPENPGKPGGEDSEKPGKPGGGDSEKPGKPGSEDPKNPGTPGTPGTDDKGDSNHLGGLTNDKDGGKPGTNDVQKGDKQLNDNGQALPQTGEARNINLIVGGVVSILIGMSLLFFRRKTKTV